MGCICVKGAKSEKKSGKSKRSKEGPQRQSPASSSSRKVGGTEVPANGRGNFSRVELQEVNGGASSWNDGSEVQAANEGNSSRKEGAEVQYSASVESSSLEGTMVEVDNGSDEDTVLLIGTDGNQSTNFSLTASEETDDETFEFGKPSAPQSAREGKMSSGVEGTHDPICTALNVRNGADGAQLAAGWPVWLSSVAGEAIRGWIPRKLDSFEKLEKIGQGTYSDVYRARDLETGKMVALKKLHFKSVSQESACFMSREILILRMLDHPNVMKLEGLITSRFSNSLHLIFEYMEHDLSGLAASCELTEPQIKCYMQQLFRGLEHCHSHGVLHRDIKCSNLLIDNNGNLKIGDFGLATYSCPDERRPRTTCVVTLWYRPLELLLGDSYYGEAVDLWSSGCILAELYRGKPIMPGRTEVEQLHKIYKLCGSPSEQYWRRLRDIPHAAIFKPPKPYSRCVAEVFKDLSPSALALLEVLLAIEPELRGSATTALQSEFFSTECLPCDPSSLPKYPPSKEMNVRARNEATQRWRAMGGRGTELESSRNDINEFSDVLLPRSNAEFKASKKKWKGKSMGNIAAYRVEEDGDSCFTLQLSKGYSQFSHSLQMDALDNLEKHGDEEPHLNSLTPFHPSEYIELEFESSNNPPKMTGTSGFPDSVLDIDNGNGNKLPQMTATSAFPDSVLGIDNDNGDKLPQMTATSGFPDSVLDIDNDNGNSKLFSGGETSVDWHVHQEQSLNAENGHMNDAKLSESIYVLEKPEQSLNNGDGNTYATLSGSNHVLEEPEQSLNRGNKTTDDARLSEPIHLLEEPEKLPSTRIKHTDHAELSESTHVLDKPEYSSHNDDNEKAQLHLDETATVYVDAPDQTITQQIAQNTDSTQEDQEWENTDFNPRSLGNMDQDRKNADAAVMISNVEIGK